MLALLLFSGCAGDDGINGSDAIDFDHVPPEVYITEPLPNQRVYLDTLTFKAEAFDEDGMIDSVKFHIGNYDPDLTTVTTPPYIYYMEEMTLKLESFTGFLDVYATAYDTAGNFQNSPLFFIDFRKFIGRDTLTYLAIQGHPEPKRIPGRFKRFTDIETDSIINVSKYSTRFKVYADCELVGAEYYLVHRSVDPEVVEYASFKSILIDPTDLGNPGAIIDSISYQPNEFSFDRWTYFDYQENGTTHMFNAGEEFFLGIKTDLDMATADSTSGIILQSTLREYANLEPDSLTNSYSYESSNSDTGWVNLAVADAEADTLNFTTEFWIRAIVDYGNGESAK
jgi:Bacterial Ig domain